jgi:hypothetical protein
MLQSKCLFAGHLPIQPDYLGLTGKLLMDGPVFPKKKFHNFSLG